MNEKKSQVVGTQSARKVLALLKCVGSHGAEGLRLKDLIWLTGQDRSTAHRLLACLIEEGFVERVAPTKLYRLSVAAMELGLVSSGMVSVVNRFRPVMQKIARESGDTVYLMMRSADYALCLHREEGPYPIKALVVEEGTRRLLGISSVGIGILARLPDDQILAMYERHAEEYDRLGLSLDRLRKVVQETRRSGFSEVTDFRKDETRGVGCAFRLSSTSYAGISIAAINSRMPAQRRRELGALLKRSLQPFEWKADVKSPRRRSAARPA